MIANERYSGESNERREAIKSFQKDKFKEARKLLKSASKNERLTAAKGYLRDAVEINPDKVDELVTGTRIRGGRAGRLLKKAVDKDFRKAQAYLENTANPDIKIYDRIRSGTIKGKNKGITRREYLRQNPEERLIPRIREKFGWTELVMIILFLVVVLIVVASLKADNRV